MRYLQVRNHWLPKSQIRSEEGTKIEITLWMYNRLRALEVKDERANAEDLAEGFQCLEG